MGCCPSTSPSTPEASKDKTNRHHHRNMSRDKSSLERRRHDNTDDSLTDQESADLCHECFANGDKITEKISKGIPLSTIARICPEPPKIKDMEDIEKRNAQFMIASFKYDSSQPDSEPKSINDGNDYHDQWNENYVRMPCSLKYVSSKKQPIWSDICQWLQHLKKKCDDRTATFRDLQSTIESCNGVQYNMACLEHVINATYSNDEYAQFMYTTLSNTCDLVLNLPFVCTQPPALLRKGLNSSVTMSQRQAASLLACAFFCLFPNRSDSTRRKEYEQYQNPNFDRLYQRGPQSKIEKLKCILNYFRRVTKHMPNGVITFQRVVLPNEHIPSWSGSSATLSDLHLTTNKKIEDIEKSLQVDFANEYIGGGVLGSGCVQEEIRFTICPEMLVSLLICEKMEENECILLIGCERYSSYKGYADSFQFDKDYQDTTPKDSWGRKWCHLVAMDAIFFREPSTQYQMKNIDRELLKAYTSFRPLGKGPDYEFGIATGNWGCGAFNGDRQLKAIIQLLAASEAGRPLIYAAFGDKKLVESFDEVYTHLKKQDVTVANLYNCLREYSRQHDRSSVFKHILKNFPPSKL